MAWSLHSVISPRDIPAEQGAQYNQDVNGGGNPEGPRRGRRDIAALSWKDKFQIIFWLLIISFFNYFLRKSLFSKQF